MPISSPISTLHLQSHSIDENSHLKQELRQLQFALATAYTPGHAALKADYERAEARAKISLSDIRAANAGEASARAEVNVLKVRLENEIVARSDAQRLVAKSRNEVGRLKKELDVLNHCESKSKRRISDLETMINKTEGNLTKAQQTVTGMKRKLKEVEGELKKSIVGGKKLKEQIDSMKRAAEEVRAANRVLKEKLKKERVVAEERENEWQKRLEAEVACAERDACKNEKDWPGRTEAELVPLNPTKEGRDKWKNKVEMTDRQPGKEEKERSRLEEVIDCIYTLPPAPSLMDGNNAALLSPAPLARVTRTVRTSPASESRSRFTSLPFEADEENVDGGKLPERIDKTATMKSGSESAASSRRRRSTGVPRSRIDGEPGTNRARARKRAPHVKLEPSAATDKREDEARSAQQSGTSGAMGQQRPSKRRKVENERDEKGSASTEKTAGRQARQSAPDGNEIVERKAGGRMLRSRRRVSYDYDKAGRDIVNSFARV